MFFLIGALMVPHVHASHRGHHDRHGVVTGSCGNHCLVSDVCGDRRLVSNACDDHCLARDSDGDHEGGGDNVHRNHCLVASFVYVFGRNGLGDDSVD